MTEEKKLKRGDVREDGMVFWGYTKAGRTGEWWVERDTYVTKRGIAREYGASYYQANRESVLQSSAEYYQSNSDRIRMRTSEYYARVMAEKPEQIRGAARARKKKRRSVDPLYVITDRIRCRIRASLRDNGYAKNSRTEEIVGCSFEDFKTHFESLFTDGMCWERFSEIHIDHIIPVSSATNEEELIALNHYTNLQPLWAKDNLQKSNKVLPVK